VADNNRVTHCATNWIPNQLQEQGAACLNVFTTFFTHLSLIPVALQSTLTSFAHTSTCDMGNMDICCACFRRSGDGRAAHSLPSNATVTESRAHGLIKYPMEQGYQSFTKEQPPHNDAELTWAIKQVTPSVRTSVPKPPQPQPPPPPPHHHVFGAGVTILETHGLHTGWARNPTGNAAKAFVNLATLQCRQHAVLEQVLMPMQVHDYIPDLSHIATVHGRLSSNVCRKVLDHVSDCMEESETMRGIEYDYEEFIECAGAIFTAVAQTVSGIFKKMVESNNGSVFSSLLSTRDHPSDRAARQRYNPSDHAAWKRDVGPNWRQDVWLEEDEGSLRKWISETLPTTILQNISVPESLQMSLKRVLGYSDVVDLAVALYTMKVLAQLQRPQYDLPLLIVGHRVAYLREFHSIVDFRGGGNCKACLILVPAMVDSNGGVVIKAIAHGL